jgi:hypothetical protein
LELTPPFHVTFLALARRRRVFGEGEEALFTEQLPVRVTDAWRAFSDKVARA